MEMHLLPMLAGAAQAHGEPDHLPSDSRRFLTLLDEHWVSV
jgi:hypothetical protein